MDLPLSIDLNSIGSIHLAEAADKNKYIHFQMPQPITEAYLPTIHDIDLKAFNLYGNNQSDKSYDMIILGEGYTHRNNWPIDEDDFTESDFGLHARKAIDAVLKSVPFKEKKQHLKFTAGVFKSKVEGTNVTLITSPFQFDFSSIGILTLEILFHLNGDQLLIIKNRNEQSGSGAFATIIPKNRLLEMPPIVPHELGHSICRL